MINIKLKMQILVKLALEKPNLHRELYFLLLK